MQRKIFMQAIGAMAWALCTLAAQAQSVQLTLGHGEPPDNPRHIAAEKFATLAKEYSGGRIEVQIAPSAQLGNDAAMITALRTGALDISVNSLGPTAAVVPEYAAWGLPFLFTSSAQALALLDGALGDELSSLSEKKGLIVLGYWDNGLRHVTNSKHPIRTLADFKGLKMRVPPDAVLVDTMQALGAQAQQIKFSELYVALQQGVVDGQENPPANIYTSKLYEVQKYLTLSGHTFQMNPFLMSKRRWDKLSQADKDALVKAGREATLYQREIFQQANDKMLAEIESKGVHIDKIDTKAMNEATKSVREKWLTGNIATYAKKVVDAAAKP